MKRIIWFISVWWWSTITWFLSTHFLPAANTCKHCGCKLLADDCSSPSWVRANTAPNEWFQSFLFFGDDILLPSFYPDLICGMLAELFPCFSLSLSLSLSLSISISCGQVLSEWSGVKRFLNERGDCLATERREIERNNAGLFFLRDSSASPSWCLFSFVLSFIGRFIF